MNHKGWYSRGYLPHWDNPGLIQFVTFRLADSLPAEQVKYWEALVNRSKEPGLARKVVDFPQKNGHLDKGVLLVLHWA